MSRVVGGHREAGCGSRACLSVAPVFVHRQTVRLAAEGHLPEMIITPAHRDLDDIVQDLEGDRGGHFDHALDRCVGSLGFDPHGGDLGEAVDGSPGDHAAYGCMSPPLRQFQVPRGPLAKLLRGLVSDAGTDFGYPGL